MRKCKETGDSSDLERRGSQSRAGIPADSDVVGSAEGRPWRERERRRHSEPDVACMCARTWRRVGRVRRKKSAETVCAELEPAIISPG